MTCLAHNSSSADDDGDECSVSPAPAAAAAAATVVVVVVSVLVVVDVWLECLSGLVTDEADVESFSFLTCSQSQSSIYHPLLTLSRSSVSGQANSAFHPFGVDKWGVSCNLLDVRNLQRRHLVNAYEVNNNNNNNNHDNVYGAVIMAELLREFTRFIWWM